MDEQEVAGLTRWVGNMKASPEGHEQYQGQNQKQRQDSHKLIIQGCRQSESSSGYRNISQCAATVRMRLLWMVVFVTAGMRRDGFQI